jgi:hypothetical protein
MAERKPTVVLKNYMELARRLATSAENLYGQPADPRYITSIIRKVIVPHNENAEKKIKPPLDTKDAQQVLRLLLDFIGTKSTSSHHFLMTGCTKVVLQDLIESLEQEEKARRQRG